MKAHRRNSWFSWWAEGSFASWNTERDIEISVRIARILRRSTRIKRRFK